MSNQRAATSLCRYLQQYFETEKTSNSEKFMYFLGPSAVRERSNLGAMPGDECQPIPSDAIISYSQGAGYRDVKLDVDVDPRRSSDSRHPSDSGFFND